MRRVAITGLGLVTPLGVGVKHTWPRLLNGATGITSTGTLDDPAYATLPSRVAGLIPRGHRDSGGWQTEDHLDPFEIRQTATFTQYAIAAAEEALQDAGDLQLSESDRRNTAVVIGSGIGNLSDQHATSLAFANGGHHKTHPLYVPKTLINMAAGHIAMRHGFRGPNLAPSTACTTGLHALIEGAQMIRLGLCDVVVAGASEACVHPLAMSGFSRARTLSTTFNETPHKASRPFDKKRDGFVIGEGAGVVILEEFTRAKKRGLNPRIYAELAGAGMSCDASHMTAPMASGLGAKLAMTRALSEAGRAVWIQRHRRKRRNIYSSVDYINAHATGTALGDAVENRAIRDVLCGTTGRSWSKSRKRYTSHSNQYYQENFCQHEPKNINVSSTKGATGHLLGAAGAVEAIFTVLALDGDVLPPTLNLDKPGDAKEPGSGPSGEDAGGGEWDLNYVANIVEKRTTNVALTNSFGFGGTNASLCFVKAEP